MVFRDKSDDVSGGAAAAPFAYAGGTQVLPSREVQHAWFELTRSRPWRSVALVPVDDIGSSVGLAYELAQMASLDPRNKLLVINAATLMSEAFGGAMTPNAGGGAASAPVAHGKYWLVDCAKQGLDDSTVGMVEVPRYLEQMRAGDGPFNMIIVASNSVLASPAAVSISRSVDAVVICASLGTTSFSDARRSIELVGEENIAGSIALRPRA